MKYTLYSYEVWGNRKEGYDINQAFFECDDLVITDEATNKDICNYLKDRGYLTTSDMRKLRIDDYGSSLEVVERKTDKPLFGLLLNC